MPMHGWWYLLQWYNISYKRNSFRVVLTFWWLCADSELHGFARLFLLHISACHCMILPCNCACQSLFEKLCPDAIPCKAANHADLEAICPTITLVIKIFQIISTTPKYQTFWHCPSPPVLSSNLASPALYLLILTLGRCHAPTSLQRNHSFRYLSI